MKEEAEGEDAVSSSSQLARFPSLSFFCIFSSLVIIIVFVSFICLYIFGKIS